MQAFMNLLLLGFSCLVIAEPTLVVRARSEIQSAKNVEFGDIAEFEGVSEDLKSQISKISLADQLPIGKQIEFSGRAISQILRDMNIFESAQKIQIKIPSVVKVVRVGTQLSEVDIGNKIKQKWQNRCQCRIEVSDLVYPKLKSDHKLTDWDLVMDMEPARGSFSLPLRARFEDESSQEIWVKGRIRHFKQVPVTRRRIELGERISSEDVVWRERDLTFSRDSVPELNELVGQKARLSLGFDQTVFTNDIVKEKILTRGEPVRIFIGQEDWQISVLGQSEQDGSLGDLVKVKNQKTNQTILGRLVRKGEVQIE
jgi:flagella basal body P-ring formation protein FlgA